MIDPWFVTGSTDGEGCFSLMVIGVTRETYVSHKWVAKFSIYLRGDDMAILHRLKEFFGCGYVNRYNRANQIHKYGYGVYEEVSISKLAEIFIPHFERFPLQTKKADDFNLWKEAVLIFYSTRRDGRIHFRELDVEQKERLREIQILLRKRLLGGNALRSYRSSEMAGTIELLR